MSNLRLTAGDKAPEFSLRDSSGKTVSSKDLRGKKFVIYFYPADDTPGCTKEACQFTDLWADFRKLKVPVLGVSPDDLDSHKRFISKYGLSIVLLSDPKLTTMKKYGAWGEKTMYGKKVLGVIRSTFLVSGDGKVLRAWYNVRADGHAQKVLEELVG